MNCKLLYLNKIALICETLPKNPDPDKPYTPFILKGYDTLENQKGRGVIIIYKESLDVNILTDISDLYSPAIFIKVSSSIQTMNLGIIYRSPNISPQDDLKLNYQVSQASKTLKNLVIVGDFNFPEIDWTNLYCSKKEDHSASIFLHDVIDCKLHQCITEFTHFKPNCRPSLIDLLLTKDKDVVYKIRHLPPLGKSHHTVITANISFDNDSPKSGTKIKKYLMDKANYNAINEAINVVDWNKELDNMCVDESWTSISSKLLRLREEHIPSITIKPQLNKKKPPTLCSSLLHIIREKKDGSLSNTRNILQDLTMPCTVLLDQKQIII